MDEVDALLNDLAERLRNGVPVGPDEKDRVRFRRQLKGYDVDDVEALLETVARRVRSGSV